MKLLGVLGGMGPGATADFLAKLAASTPATRDQDHLPVIVYSDPATPDRSDAILLDGTSPLPALVRGIEFLNASGCELIAIPCNTAHAWFDDLERVSSVPIIHIVDAVAAQLARISSHHGRVGILATAGTVKSGIYQTRLGVSKTVVLPDAADTNGVVMTAIRAIKAGDLVRGRTLLSSAITELASRGTDAIVLGCTDLSSVASERHACAGLPVMDASLALANRCVGVASQPGSRD